MNRKYSKLASVRAWRKLDKSDRKIIKNFYKDKAVVAGISAFPPALLYTSIVNLDFPLSVGKDVKSSIKRFSKLYHQERLRKIS